LQIYASSCVHNNIIIHNIHIYTYYGFMYAIIRVLYDVLGITTVQLVPVTGIDIKPPIASAANLLSASVSTKAFMHPTLIRDCKYQYFRL